MSTNQNNSASSAIVYNTRGKRIVTQEMVDRGEAPTRALGCEIPEISLSALPTVMEAQVAQSARVYNARGKRIVTQEMIDRGEAPTRALGCEIPEISP